MDESEQGPSPRPTPCRGLTLYLDGNFDPQSLGKALGLRPIRLERTAANQVTVFARKGGAYTYAVSRRIDHDHLKVTTEDGISIEERFGQLFHAIESLSDEARSQWNSLRSRTADLGLEWTNESNCGTEYDIPESIIARLAAAKLTLRISVYASEEAIQRAINQPHDDADPPTSDA